MPSDKRRLDYDQKIQLIRDLINIDEFRTSELLFELASICSSKQLNDLYLRMHGSNVE